MSKAAPKDVKRDAQLERAVAASTSPVDGDGHPLKRVLLLPMGEITPRDGREPWLLKDKAHAEQVIAASRAFAGRQDLAIDYDHQTVFGVKPGVAAKAPASGWIKPDTFEASDEGISAEVKWTPAAAAHLEAGEYRYLSPVFDHTKKGRLVTRLVGAALTNIPCLEQLPAVASQETPEDDETMKTVAEKLGLAEDADEAAICAAIEALQADHDHLRAAAAALQLGDDAKGEDIVAGVTAARAAATPDPKKFVPIEGFNQVNERLSVLETERAATAVDQAVEAGKLAPALRDWGLNLFKSDETAFASYIEKATPVVQPGSTGAGGKPPESDPTKLSDEERANCARFGWDADEFLKAKQEEAKAAR